MAKNQEFVVDASVVTKWFLIEANSHLAMKLRDSFATGRMGLAVPTLLFYEVINALRFSGVFTESDLTVAAKSLSKYRFSIWRPRGKLLELSAALSIREDLTIYDACYIALAQGMSSKVITEDRELLSKFPMKAVPLDRIEVVRGEFEREVKSRPRHPYSVDHKIFRFGKEFEP